MNNFVITKTEANEFVPYTTELHACIIDDTLYEVKYVNHEISWVAIKTTIEHNAQIYLETNGCVKPIDELSKLKTIVLDYINTKSVKKTQERLLTLAENQYGEEFTEEGHSVEIVEFVNSKFKKIYYSHNDITLVTCKFDSADDRNGIKTESFKVGTLLQKYADLFTNLLKSKNYGNNI